MACNQDELLAIGKASYVIASIEEDLILLFAECLIGGELIDHHAEGIDDGVAGDIDVAKGCLSLEVAL